LLFLAFERFHIIDFLNPPCYFDSRYNKEKTLIRELTLYKTLKNAFIGLNTRYKLANGKTARRVYLDSGASTLMMKPANDAVQSYLAHYANTHTTVHTSAKITSTTMTWAYNRVLDFVGADRNEYLCAFLGSGTTAAANRVADGLANLRPEKDVVLISSMEHHSNDLSHRAYSKTVEHIPLTGSGLLSGQVCIEGLKKLLEQYKNRVNYVAITGVSNVTGIINPIQEIAELVHRYDAYLVVDGAQMVAHMPVAMNTTDIDFFLFSGHKIYAPGSPGVLIGKRSIVDAMKPFQFGGGMVESVSKWGYVLSDDPLEREHAGTPNIPGAITLACALESLSRVGMQTIFEKERELIQYTLKKLETCRTSIIYGEQQSLRVASIAFNLKGIGHGLVAAILNDYHGIAVRNQCFCAHPYVQEMLIEEIEELACEDLDNDALEELIQDHRGMVRASFGLYTTEEDINALVNALINIEDNIDTYKTHYDKKKDGSYSHKTFGSDTQQYFSIVDELEKCLLNDAEQKIHSNSENLGKDKEDKEGKKDEKYKPHIKGVTV